MIGGVKSKSKAKSIRVLNGRDRYDQWEFTYKPYSSSPKPAMPGGGRRTRLDARQVAPVAYDDLTEPVAYDDATESVAGSFPVVKPLGSGVSRTELA